MESATRKTRISLFLAAGLLVLAGVFSSAVPASAQAQEACPRPTGATPVEPPDVTAPQVENGTGTLMDFALSVRERSREHSQEAAAVAQGLYIGCLVRQDNSVWRAGSTYIVTLTLDGRVFLNAKDMSLSGRQLNPLIYGSILSALGVSPAVLADLASPDPATQQSAFAELIATLSQEPDGAFDATVAMGPVPGIPGASGYAAVYVSPELQSPIVLLAGFDLTESHLVSIEDENIDYGDPAITAAQVVDRETLKAFVTQAGNYMLEVQRAGDPRAASRARIALRDPNGPWRDGSVYLYVLDLSTNIITFHAAFPDRFENRPLVPTVHDTVTGEFILPQVVEAAKSSPEGGFVQYYFDDPNDHTDSADIPKVGYAREFSGQVRGPGGQPVMADFIVGSGFYLSSPQVIAARQNAVVETVLPQVMRAMTASTVDAISGRLERAASGAAPDAALSFGGASTLSDAVMANGQALEDGTFDLTRLLANSSFTLALNAADGGGGGLFENLTLWGSGDYRSFSGGTSETVNYDGSVVSASLGFDTRLSAEVLAGMTLAQSTGAVDYTDSYAVTGEVTTSVTSLNPYVGWQMPSGMNLWAAAGYGMGEVEIDDASADTQSSDLTQQTVAVGASGPLMTSDRMFEGGTTSLNLKGEAAFTSADIDGSGSLESMSLSASRQRLVLEGVYDQRLASGATFSPSLEIGVRNDGGDGETGTGIETGAGLRYSDAASGLTLEGRARTLLSHGGDYEEWGVSGLVRIDPGASGQGLAFSLQPAWGRTASGVQQLWEAGSTGVAIPADDAAARLHAEVGYGLGAAPGLGAVTPYAALGLAGESTRTVRMGTRWQAAANASLSLEGTRFEAANDDGHGLMLRGALRW